VSSNSVKFNNNPLPREPSAREEKGRNAIVAMISGGTDGSAKGRRRVLKVSAGFPLESRRGLNRLAVA